MDNHEQQVTPQLTDIHTYTLYTYNAILSEMMTLSPWWWHFLPCWLHFDVDDNSLTLMMTVKNDDVNLTITLFDFDHDDYTLTMMMTI